MAVEPPRCRTRLADRCVSIRLKAAEEDLLEYRRLGRSGLIVSVVGLGTNNFGGRCDREQSEAVVHHALDLGITCIDTADIYGRGLSEEFIGGAIRGHRHDVVLATKFAGPVGEGPMQRGTSRRYEAVAASLKRLQTDYIDLLQIHFPDPETPIDETLRALDDLVRAGSVRYLGCSNFKAWQVVEAQWTARSEHLNPLISAQNRYNLLDRSIEAELVPACTRYGLGLLPYPPLAGGFLTGKYQPGAPPPEGARLAGGGRMAEQILTEGNFAVLQRLQQFADVRGRSVLDVAIAWLVAQPFVGSVIAGATKPQQLDANVNAGSWQMSADEVAEVGRLTQTG
jgi:aryl-alcohol dehydrogenase-like predicted oxidoreductase